MTDLLSLYHVALVVPDLAEAMDTWAPMTAQGWSKPQSVTVNVQWRGEVCETPVHWTYSLGAPPYLELVENCADSVWQTDRVLYHHTGYWTSDMRAATELVESQGMEFEAGGLHGDRRLFAYYLTRDGARIELVDTVIKPAFDRWVSGGDFG